MGHERGGGFERGFKSTFGPAFTGAANQAARFVLQDLIKAPEREQLRKLRDLQIEREQRGIKRDQQIAAGRTLTQASQEEKAARSQARLRSAGQEVPELLAFLEDVPLATTTPEGGPAQTFGPAGPGGIPFSPELIEQAQAQTPARRAEVREAVSPRGQREKREKQAVRASIESTRTLRRKEINRDALRDLNKDKRLTPNQRRSIINDSEKELLGDIAFQAALQTGLVTNDDMAIKLKAIQRRRTRQMLEGLPGEDEPTRKKEPGGTVDFIAPNGNTIKVKKGQEKEAEALGLKRK